MTTQTTDFMTFSDHNSCYESYCSQENLDPKKRESLDCYHDDCLDGNFLASTSSVIYESIAVEYDLLEDWELLEYGYLDQLN